MKKITIPSSPLFAGIAPEEILGMLACLSALPRSLEKGEAIFRAGAVTGSMALILTGRAEIARDDYRGNRQVIGTAFPGDLVGESYACLRTEPLLMTVTVPEPADVLYLDAAKILTACSPSCAHHNRLIQNLVKILAGKNLQLTRKIDHMSKRSIRDKLLSYLLEAAGREKSMVFQIPYNRQQLADYLAVDRSALSAELSRMKKDGLIMYEKNRFTILKKHLTADAPF